MVTRKFYLIKVLFVFATSLVLMLVLLRSSHAVASTTSFIQDEPYRIEEFNISTPGELEVRTSGGHITVEGSNANTVRVEMFVRKNSKALSVSDNNLENWEIDISKSGNAVKAIAKYKSNNRWSWGSNDRPSISFVVYTPTQISSDLATSGGHIKAHGLEGNQKIKTSGGHLDLANLKGTIEAKTSGGHIDLTNIEGDLDAKTSGGHITVKAVTGKMELKTSGGHIKLDDISGSIKASTSGGNIKADLKTIAQFVNLKTRGGNISIRIPKDIGLDLELKGMFVRGKLKNFSGEMSDNRINGKLNGGGPKVTARTSGGGIKLSFN